MNLALTLAKQKHTSLHTRTALAIALECYKELQSSYGFAMRNAQLLDIEKVMALHAVFEKTKEGETIILKLSDVLLLVTVYDIAQKALSSHEPYRFVHAFQNDAKKRSSLVAQVMAHCNEMTTDLSEQAIYRHEVGQHRLALSQFVY